MATYCFVVCSNSFKVKEENIENVSRALEYFEESYVNKKGEAFIGSYQQTLSDDLKVLIYKKTNKVVATYDFSYQMDTDVIEENCYRIEQDLEDAGIPSEDEYDIEDFEDVEFADFIQQNLADGEHAFIKEVGNEKMRYAVGCGLLISKDLIRWIDLDAEANKALEGK